MRLEELNQLFRDQLSEHPLVQGKALVTGEGLCCRPPLMLVGEAPGEQEAIQRRPFVGKAGKMLDSFLEILCIARSSIYITNTVKIRPTLQGPYGRLSNRPPNQDELALFLPWLMEETAVVDPKLLVTLGNTPLKAYLGEQAVVGRYHGRSAMTSQGVPLFALYHPAAVIYNPALNSAYEQDLILLKGHLASHYGVVAK
jgi:uracil-DNA glycosylase family 4